MMDTVLLFIVLFVCVFVGLPIWIVFRMRRLTALEYDVRRIEERLDAFAETLVAFEHQMRTASPAVSLASPAPAPVDPPVARRDRPAPRVEPRAQVVREARPAVLVPVPAVQSTNERPPSLWNGEPQPVLAAAAVGVGAQQIVYRDLAPVAPDPDAHHETAAIELEETLGTNWLNKLGALLLVVGAAFFLTQQVRAVGPLGKDVIGLGVGLALLAAGVVAERRTAYAMFSRGVMAAGWGLLFFTAFAMHHVAAARVIDSEAVGLALMLAIAGGMVGHALRYRSETVTTLAFLFAFGTVAISRDTAFTLSACVVLALAASVVSVRLRWYRLELVAIAGTFLNHFLWLPILAHADASALPGRAYLSLAMLGAYWLTFRVSFVIRRDLDEAAERWSALAAVLATVGLMVVAGQHPLSNNTVFVALLGLGVADALFAYLVRSRRLAFVTLTTMAAALVGASFPVRYGARVVSVAWLVEAQALVMMGVRTKDGLFTRLGMLGLVCAGMHVTVADVGPVLQARQLAQPTSAPGLALLLTAVAAVYYTNAFWTLPRHRDAFASPIEQALVRDLSFAGVAALMAAAWALEPGRWMAPMLMGVAASVMYAARRMQSSDLWLQSQAAAACALARIVGSNLADLSWAGPVKARASVLTLGAVQHHLFNRYGRMPEQAADAEVSIAHSWIGSALLIVLAWYELAPLQVALAWAAGGVLLLELGIRFDRSDWRDQAVAAWGLAFARVFVVNLNAAGGLTGPASVATLPLALIFYYGYERLNGSGTRVAHRLPELIAGAGTITVAALCRVVLSPALVVEAWGILAVLTAVLARVLGRREFLRQSSGVGVAVAPQAIAVNLYARSYFEQWWTRPAVTVGIAAALVLATLPLARRRSGTDTGSAAGPGWYRPEYVPFFVPLLLATWTTAVTLAGAAVTVAWGTTAVAAFIVALWARERVFRLSALALLLGSVVRIVAVDVWRFDQQGRYVTFMALGAALLLVSFLYSRYRERMREYL